MTLTPWFYFGGAIVAVIAVFTAVWRLPATERELTHLARHALAHSPADFSQVQITFSGQEATLTGKVATQALKDQATATIARGLRAKSGLAKGQNPVTAVHNDLRVDPYLHESETPDAQNAQPGFLILAKSGNHVFCFGKVPDEFAKDEVLSAAAKRFPQATIHGAGLVHESEISFHLPGSGLGPADRPDGIEVLMTNDEPRFFPFSTTPEMIRRAFPGFSFPPGLLESALETQSHSD